MKTEDELLDFIFKLKDPDAYKRYHKVGGRKCYANSIGHQIHPLSGTIFEKSETPLSKWFKAIKLIHTSKSRISAKELHRQVWVTYKTAWRMKRVIKAVSEEDKSFKIIRKVISQRI